MNRPLTTLFLALVMTAACGETPEPIAEQHAALYVDVTGGGHGPFSCVNADPFRGYAKLTNPTTGVCQMVRGDMTSASHPGYVVSGSLIPAGATTMDLPNHELGNTYGYACKSPATGPASNPCAGQPSSDVYYFNNQSFTHNLFPWTPGAIVLGYMVGCPYRPSMDHFCYMTGANTPLDGSGYTTVRVYDDFGASLNAPNGTSTAGDCMMDMATYGLGYGIFAAVYTGCGP